MTLLLMNREGESDTLMLFITTVPLVKSTDVKNGCAAISCPNNCIPIVALAWKQDDFRKVFIVWKRSEFKTK